MRPATSATWTPPPMADHGRAAPRVGRATRRPSRRALRHDPAAVLGRRPDDRRLLGRRRPRRARGRVRLQPPGGGTRIGDKVAAPGVRPVVRPDPRRAWRRAVRDRGCLRQHRVRLRQRPPPGAHRLDPDGSSPRCCRPATRPRMTGQPVTPMIDNLVLEVGDGAGSIDDLVAGMRAGPAGHLPVVHPRGRSADHAAHRPDPRRRLPRRGRRDRRRGQQLPLEREPDRSAQPLLARQRHGAAFSREWGDDYFSRTAMPGPAHPRLQHVERVAGAEPASDVSSGSARGWPPGIGASGS